MADDATPAGDDQQTAPQEEEQTTAGEGQQETPDERDERIAKLEEELKNTNSYVTRLQQGKVEPEPAEPKPDTAPDDGSDEYAQYGLTKEQVTALRKVTGADELQAKLSAYEKREQEREQQTQKQQIESQFSEINKKYADKGVPLPATPAEKGKLLQYMQDNGIFNMDVAFREMHGSRLGTKAETPKAAVSDRSDANVPSENDAYSAAIAKAKADAIKAGRQLPTLDELAEIEARYKGNPSVHEG